MFMSSRPNYDSEQLHVANSKNSKQIAPSTEYKIAQDSKQQTNIDDSYFEILNPSQTSLL